MPDLAEPTRFHKQLNQVENRYIREAMALYRQLRVDLLEIVNRLGLNSINLQTAIRARFEQFRQAIERLAGTQIDALATVSGRYVDRSMDTLRRFETGLPTFSSLQLIAFAEIQDILDGFIESANQFVASIESRFILAIDDIRLNEEPEAEAVRRLLSPNLVDGRATVYRHGLNTLRFESQKRLWTAGVALAGAYFLIARQESGVRLRKQVVASVDSRTTKCCLRAHGQIKDVGQPFELTAPPCGNTRKMHPPFPNHECRTVEAPYLPVLEDLGPTTEEMIGQARTELRSRG